MQYKYVNKRDATVVFGGITFTPYAGYFSNQPNTDLDIFSNGWDLDRYIDNVLSNTSNDPIQIGTIRYSPTNPGNGWLKCDMSVYNKADYPELSTLYPIPALKREDIVGDNINIPSSISAGFTASNGTIYLKDYLSKNRHMWSTSDRGVTWTKHVDLLPVSSWSWTFRNIGNLYIGISRDMHHIVSTDGGMTWSMATTTPDNPANMKLSGTVLVADSRFVYIASAEYDTINTYCAISSDGVTWTKYLIPSNILQTYSGTPIIIPNLDNEGGTVLLMDSLDSGTRVWITLSNGSIYQYRPVSVPSPYSRPLPHYMSNNIHSPGNYFICLGTPAPVVATVWDYNYFINTSANVVSYVRGGSGIGKFSNYIIGWDDWDSTWIGTPDVKTWYYSQSDPFDIGGAIDNEWIDYVCMFDSILFRSYWKSSDNTYRIAIHTVDPLKFTLPSLPDKAGQSAYIYAGA